MVLDEHGTAIGLAFREDALEEIVGPLGDEFDDEEPDFVEFPDGSFELRGRMPLPELEDRLDFDLSEEEREEEDTIGGARHRATRSAPEERLMRFASAHTSPR